MNRLLHNELKKSLKNPIVIIGIIVLLMLLASLAFVYTPKDVSTKNDIDETLTAQDIYNNYAYSDSPIIYERLDQANQILSYYNTLKIRNDKINQLHNEIQVSYDNLALIRQQGDTTKINEQGTNIYNSLKEYCNLLLIFDDVHNIDYINTIINYPEYYNNFNDINILLSEIQADVENNSENLGNIVYTRLSNKNFKEMLTKSTDVSTDFATFTMNSLYDKIKSSYNNYQDCLRSTTSTGFSQIRADNFKTQLLSDIKNFEVLYNQMLQFDYNIILCKENIKQELTNTLSASYDILFQPAYERSEHLAIMDSANKQGLLNVLANFINNFTIAMLDADVVADLNICLNQANEDFQENEKLIQTYYNANNSLSLQSIVFKQSELSKSIISIINNTIVLEYYDNYDLYDKYLDDNAIYQFKCDTALAKYNILNNSFDYDTIDNYQFNLQVNNKLTTYDYIVFAMKIATILIIIIQIFIISNSISGEAKNGSLRMTLMSPNKRSTIFNSKLVCSIIVSTILLILSLLISSLVGTIVLGEETRKIVTIFNASEIIEIQPIVAILINFACNWLYLISCIIIFYLITVIFKNLYASVISSICAFGIILGLAKISLPIFALIPSNNFDLNKFFYAKTYTSENILNKLFDGISYSSQNFYFSLAITLLTTLIIYIISLNLFKKKSY